MNVVRNMDKVELGLLFRASRSRTKAGSDNFPIEAMPVLPVRRRGVQARRKVIDSEGRTPKL